MSHDATVNAGDIARLVDVGRAAVSNWRRRHEDFPQPVGGTASSPLFSLREVEDWLRRNGKLREVALADRVWQRLRAAGDDLRLGHLVAAAGYFLLARRREEQGGGLDVVQGLPTSSDGQLDDPELTGLLAELAEQRGHVAAFEFLCERYVEAHSRQLFVTPREVASLMVRLACQDGETVLDPACGLGTLLLAVESPPGAEPKRALGQEISETAATITAVRLLLRDVPARIVRADSLRRDGFPGDKADAVVCDPPFNERAWGYDELTGDPRWEYGLPPRGESELAWVQHCLARVKPGGMVAILMPTAAASRRPGKRIRGNLLRSGALRAVVTLSVGGPDLWLLRRPDAGQRPPSRILMMEAADDLSVVEHAWHRHQRHPDTEPREQDYPAVGASVPIIELLDDDVDLSPARHRLRHSGQELGREVAATLERFRAITLAPPNLEVLASRRRLPVTTVGELVRAGLITVRHAPARTLTRTASAAEGRTGRGDGEVTVLTAEDLAEGRPPSGRTTLDPGLVTVEAGDVVASAMGTARVAALADPGQTSPHQPVEENTVLGPYLTLFRVDRGALDPDFLAGVLRSADPRTHTSSTRVDVRRARIPRLSLAEQQAYGNAFRQLIMLEDALRQTATLGGNLVRLGFDGLIEGHLLPGS